MEEKETWWYQDYNPKITIETWLKLLHDEKIFNFNSMCMMKRMLDIGGEATNSELAKKYGRAANSYTGIGNQLAKRIMQKTNCKNPPNQSVWPVLFLGRGVTKDDNDNGEFIWKLRPELEEALKQMDANGELEKYPLYEVDSSKWQHLLSAYKTLLKEHQNVAFDDELYKWETITYSAGKSWKEILLYLLGKTESSKKASNLFYYSALSNAKVFLDDSHLDSVMNSLCSESEDLDIRLDRFKSDINELTSNLAENYARPDDERSASVFLTCRNPQKYTFYKPSYYEKLCNYLQIKTEPAGKKYSHYLNLISDFETHVKADSEIMDFYNSHTSRYEKSTKLIAQNIIYTLFESGAKFVNLNGESDMKNSLAEKLKNLLLHTHNLILHGAPGTGKTHLAHEIAKELGCGKNEVGFVQFHPSYDYTDFVEGLRPVKSSDGTSSIGFERKDGVFKEFCKRALENPASNFLFIIDEINRGELSKIFGELFYAIEPGYRGEKGRIQTQYQNLVEESDVFKSGFFIPENVYIIGTMNDIDRSVDTMDFAFRRRFTFYEIEANYFDNFDKKNKIEFGKDHLGMFTEIKDESIRKTAITKMKNLNNSISKIEGLNSSYHIGGAYFLKLNELGGDFNQLWSYHLEGLLCEYLRGRDDAETKLGELKNAYDNASHSE